MAEKIIGLHKRQSVVLRSCTQNSVTYHDRAEEVHGQVNATGRHDEGALGGRILS